MVQPTRWRMQDRHRRCGLRRGSDITELCPWPARDWSYDALLDAARSTEVMRHRGAGVGGDVASTRQKNSRGLLHPSSRGRKLEQGDPRPRPGWSGSCQSQDSLRIRILHTVDTACATDEVAEITADAGHSRPGTLHRHPAGSIQQLGPRVGPIRAKSVPRSVRRQKIVGYWCRPTR